MEQISRPPEPSEYPIKDARLWKSHVEEVTNILVRNEPKDIELLLEQDWASSYRTPQSHQTLFHMAAKAGALTAVRMLFEKGFDPNVQDAMGETPLHLAAKEISCSRVSAALLEAGANPMILNSEQESTLHLAAGSGSLDVVNALIQCGLNPNAKDCRGETPLHRAAQKGAFGSVISLIKAGSEIDVKDTARRTPFQLAIKGNHDRVGQLFAAIGHIDKGSKIYATKHLERIFTDSPLRNAIKSRSETVLRMCLERFPEVSKDDFKWAQKWYDEDEQSGHLAFLSAHMAKQNLLKISALGKAAGSTP